MRSSPSWDVVAVVPVEIVVDVPVPEAVLSRGDVAATPLYS